MVALFEPESSFLQACLVACFGFRADWGGMALLQVAGRKKGCKTKEEFAAERWKIRDQLARDIAKPWDSKAQVHQTPQNWGIPRIQEPRDGGSSKGSSQSPASPSKRQNKPKDIHLAVHLGFQA